jgi:hypothetical protein
MSQELRASEHAPLRVSLSKSKSSAGNLHTQFVVGIGPFENIKSFILQRPWSPIVWEGGIRRGSNFESSSLIALDFDSGEWGLEDAIKYCEVNGLRSIIGTTKSHQVAKKTPTGAESPPVDRFRVIIQASECKSKDDFKYTMKTFMQSVPADKSCCDTARFYYPCKEIVWANFEGKPADWLTAPFDETDEYKELLNRRICESEYRETPPLIVGYITYGAKYPNRHKTCYIVGAELAKRGFDAEEIVQMLISVKSPLLVIGVDDVRRCIHNAAAAVGQRFKKVISLKQRSQAKNDDRSHGESTHGADNIS